MPIRLLHEDVRVFFSLVQTTSLFLVLSYAYCWSPSLAPLQAEPLRKRSKLLLVVFFSGVAIMGNYLGMRMPGGAIANSRAVGAVLSGLLGGPVIGVAVGVISGAHRVWLGGITAFSGAVATTFEGLLAGGVRMAMGRTPSRVVDWRVAALTTLVGEVVHQGLLLLISRPTDQVLALVRVIGVPMVLSNSIGAALFMTVLRDRQRFLDRVGAASSEISLEIAKRTLGLMQKGLGREVAVEVVRIVRAETGVGAVALTDTERLLAYDGLGADHHPAGEAIRIRETLRAIETHEVVVADAEGDPPYRCPIDPDCPVASIIVVPLQVEGTVVGTLQLFEPANRRLRQMNRALAEGLAALLSSQLVTARYREQRHLLTVAELKLLQAQVNPHFLFNSLNTIIAITRKNPDRARELLIHLSHFFRKNLKRSGDVSSLAEELEHVSSYLEIEKARFGDRLRVEIDVDPGMLEMGLPTFTLQPLIENAIRHGLSTLLAPGVARIRARREGGLAVIDVEDTAGAYHPPGATGGGLGMRIVDRRIKDLLGAEHGVSVHCEPGRLTRVRVTLPEAGLPRG